MITILISGDGVAVLRYMNEVYDDSIKRPLVSESTVKVEPKKLNFELSTENISKLKKAGTDFEKWLNTLNVLNISLLFLLYT